MFNPYLMDVSKALEPRPGLKGKGEGLAERLRSLDSDDLILLLILMLLVKDGNQDSVWSMAVAMLYLLL